MYNCNWQGALRVFYQVTSLWQVGQVLVLTLLISASPSTKCSMETITLLGPKLGNVTTSLMHYTITQIKTLWPNR